MIRNKLVEILIKYKQWLKNIGRLKKREDSSEDDITNTNLVYPDFSIFKADLSKADLSGIDFFDLISRVDLREPNLSEEDLGYKDK